MKISISVFTPDIPKTDPQRSVNLSEEYSYDVKLIMYKFINI